MPKSIELEKRVRSSPQRRSHLVVLTLRNLSPNRSQKRPIYHLNCESQARICRIELAAYSLEVFFVDEASATLQHDSLQTPPRIAIHVEDNGCFWICLDILDLCGVLFRADVYMLAIEYGTDWNVVWHPGRANRGHSSDSLRFDEILLSFCKRHSSSFRSSKDNLGASLLTRPAR